MATCAEYLYTGESLRPATGQLYSPAGMDWQTIRRHYVRVFKEHGETQIIVAARGGLRQPKLSEMMRMDDPTSLGPQVDTLLRAIAGLGVPLSDFFLQIERQTKADLRSPAAPPHNAPLPEEAKQHAEADPVFTPEVVRDIQDKLTGLGSALDRLVPRTSLRAPGARARASKAKSRTKTRRAR